MDPVIAFRTDASLQIGTGHVMRCLTLAGVLRDNGAQCIFITKPHQGHLMDMINQLGHTLAVLDPPESVSRILNDTAHAAWLGTTWTKDATQTLQAIGGRVIDWLVVDHYALDYRWERALRHEVRRVMVIDDLADRPHYCDLLLDQNLGRKHSDYEKLLGARTQTLIGPQYALLRPEFAQWRNYSLGRRKKPQLKNLLVTMGGVDKDNATGQVLSALQDCALPADLQITVVLGPHAPWLREVNAQATNMDWPTHVLTGVSNMAQLMADSDLAIGAAGATAWERCAVGLPTLVLIIADNQMSGAKALQEYGACTVVENVENLASEISDHFRAQKRSNVLQKMSKASAALTAGNGATRVANKMLKTNA